MRKLRWVTLVVVLLAGPALLPARSALGPEGAGIPAVQAPTIVVIRGRGAVITVTASADGPRYSARTASGKLVADRLSLERLQATNPACYHQLNSASATATPRLVADCD